MNQKNVPLRDFWNKISDYRDKDGFHLFRAAQDILGKFTYSTFPYEDNNGFFEDADGHTLLRYLLVQYDYKLGEANANKHRWETVSSCYEKCVDLTIDETTPEYRDFEAKLYVKVLEQLGILTPAETKAKEVFA